MELGTQGIGVICFLFQANHEHSSLRAFTLPAEQSSEEEVELECELSFSVSHHLPFPS